MLAHIIKARYDVCRSVTLNDCLSRFTFHPGSVENAQGTYPAASLFVANCALIFGPVPSDELRHHARGRQTAVSFDSSRRFLWPLGRSRRRLPLDASSPHSAPMVLLLFVAFSSNRR